MRLIDKGFYIDGAQTSPHRMGDRAVSGTLSQPCERRRVIGRVRLALTEGDGPGSTAVAAANTPLI